MRPMLVGGEARDGTGGDRLEVLDLDADPNLAPENHLDLPTARERLRALA